MGQNAELMINSLFFWVGAFNCPNNSNGIPNRLLFKDLVDTFGARLTQRLRAKLPIDNIFTPNDFFLSKDLEE